MVHVLVTGGAGFIGSNFVRWAHRAHADWHITTLDKLTYAGRLENLREIILHVLTETAVHAGHLDATRELIDGRTWLVLV